MFPELGIRALVVTVGAAVSKAAHQVWNITGDDDPSVPWGGYGVIAKSQTTPRPYLTASGGYWMRDEFSVFEVGDDKEFGGIKMTWIR